MRFDKFTTKFQQAVSDAQSIALGHDNSIIEPQHLLLALLTEPSLAQLAQRGSSLFAEFPLERLKQREQLARGPLSVGAPGNLAGWCRMVDDYGTKKLPELFAPAIKLARDGFSLIEFNVEEISGVTGMLRAQSDLYPEWSKNYLENISGGAPRLGAVLKQTNLARTLEALANEGPGLLYGGALGQKLIDRLTQLGVEPMNVTPAEFDAMIRAEIPKWAEVEPVRTIVAGSAVKFIKGLVNRFGVPNHIITDNGSQLTSNLFRSYCANLGTQICYAPVAHPRSNGQAERANAEVLRGLRLAHAGNVVALTLDGHQRRFLQRRFGDGHGAGQRMQDTDLDGFGGLQGEREQAAEHQGTGGEGGLQ